MRTAKSKRKSAYFKHKGYLEFDIVQELLSAGYKYRHIGTGFVCEKRIGNLLFSRFHVCHWELSKIVFRHYAARNLTSYQNTCFRFSVMSSPLTKKIQSVVREKGVELVKIGGFRHTRPAPLAKLKPDPGVQQVLDNTVVDLALKERVEKFHHSSEERDLGLMAAGFTVLLDKPSQDFDFEVFYDLFLQVCLETNGQTVNPGPCTPVEMCNQVQPSSSCGNMPLNSLFGACVGTKKEMHNAAVAVNVAAETWGGIPGLLPYKPVSKDEVIKKGKKVRTIMIESQPNVIVLKHYFGQLVSDEKRIPQGRAIGLSTVGGSFKSILMRWFLIWVDYHSGGWNEFLSWVEHQPFSESDKTAWESSTNESDGLAYALGLLLQVEVPGGDDMLLSRALADYLNPGVQIDGDTVYFAPWRVPSGSYLTAHGNTERHWLMAKWVCNYFDRHGGAGDVDCQCKYCDLVRGVEGFGTKYSQMELRLLSAFVVMGDDFIGFGYGAAVFNSLIDQVFGTTTKSEVKPFFSVPGLDVPNGVEFLKKHFYLDKQFATWNVRCFREASRVVAKLFYGRARKSPAAFRAALLSAIWDVGYNRALYDWLVGLLNNIPAAGSRDVRKQLEKFVKRNPAVADLSVGYVPEFAMVINCDASLLRPLEKVWWSNVTRAMATPVEWY